MKNIDVLETQRLIARRIQASDFSLLYQMYQNPEIAATLGGIKSAEETRKSLAWNLAQWVQNGFGLWLWFDKKSQKFVGRAGIRKIDVEGQDVIEVAYALMPNYWKQGLATEMAQECVKAAFEKLKLAELVCLTLTINKASQRVMEKLGFCYIKSISRVGMPHVFYKLRANYYWNKVILFEPLAEYHLELLVNWLNKPHVKAWWNDHLTDDEIRSKYRSRIGNPDILHFIIYLHGKPIGFIQYYYANRVGGGWWPDETEGTVGIDQFIGEEDYINQGYGTWLIRTFLNELFKNIAITRIIVDVDPANHRAIRCYEKAGFKLVGEVQTPDGLALLMEIERQ